MCTILPRIQQIVESEGITISAMERSIGASKGVLSRAISNGTDIQSKWIQKVVENYPRYSAGWLLTGEGSMLKGDVNAEPLPNELPQLGSTASKDTTGAIPLVSEKAVGGFASEHFKINDQDVLAYYVVPNFRFLGVDFMIEVVGDSMMPRLYPGDVIACSTLRDSKFIQWNKCHLIATKEQGLIVKRLMPSDHIGEIKAISDNKDYPPFIIPADEITGIARVVGVIHLE